MATESTDEHHQFQREEHEKWFRESHSCTPEDWQSEIIRCFFDNLYDNIPDKKYFISRILDNDLGLFEGEATEAMQESIRFLSEVWADNQVMGY